MRRPRRFAGGGLVIDEAVSWTADKVTMEPTVKQTWFHGAKWAPEGHPVRRVIDAAIELPTRSAVVAA